MSEQPSTHLLWMDLEMSGLDPQVNTILEIATLLTDNQLEIVADNVKCAHGATVSQLSGEDVFYLQSRGLDIQQAKDLLIRAFAVELLDGFQIPSLAQELTHAVLGHIHQHPPDLEA